MNWARSALARIGENQPAALVTVLATEGSVPREAGAWMAVFAQEVVGTIGGGHVEFTAIEEARRRLRGEPAVGSAVPTGFSCGPRGRLTPSNDGTFQGCDDVNYTPAYPLTARLTATVYFD